MKPTERKQLLRRLSVLQRRWIAGRAFALLCWIVGWSCVFLAAYLLFDLFAALPPQVRVGVNIAWAAVAVLSFIVGLIAVSQFDKADAARTADHLLSEARQPVLSAYELGETSKRGNELSTYLWNRSVGEGVAALNRLGWSQHFPRKSIMRGLRVLLVMLLVPAVVLLIQRKDADTLLARAFFPMRDIPPVSPFEFQVEPESPAIVYGGDAELSVSITGAPVLSQVWIWTRQGGRIHKAACFQESAITFSQRLENVVQPLEFCFVAGRARSRWHRINLKLQPRIVVAQARLTSPAYTGSTMTEFFVGNEAFSGLPGTKAEVTVTSNRPLLDGRVVIKPRNGAGSKKTVSGTVVDGNRIRFDWTIRHDADLDLTIRDLQGTRNPRPLVIRQRLLKDAAPQIVIHNPPAFVMATPDARIQLAASAEDDYGIRRMEWVRTLVGYRERFSQLPIVRSSQVEVDETVDLALAGFSPGQTLEMYLEACDTNPELTGIASSSIVRVKIISNAQYADMIRVQTTIEEFTARFRLAYERMEELRKKLEALQKSLKGDANADELNRQIAEVQKELESAAAMFNRLAQDFAAYKLEEDLKKTAEDVANQLRKGAKALSRSPSSAAMSKQIDAMLKEFGHSLETLKKQQDQANEVGQIARIMEMAAQFQQFIQRQKELKQSLSRYKNLTAKQDLSLLKTYGKRQDRIRKELKEWAKKLVQKADKLPQQYRNLKRELQTFYENLEESNATAAMSDCVTATENQNGPGAFRQASIALERLEQLLKKSQGTCFGGMCQGQFSMTPKQELEETLRQMLGAICRRLGSGKGKGQGSGQGMGMAQGQGFSQGGYSGLDVPILGPKRMRMARQGSGRGKGNGESGEAGKARITKDASERLHVSRRTVTGSRSVDADAVPEKYTEAVKRYFTQETKR